MSEPIRVIFVDDEPALRASWEKVLAGEKDFALAACLSNADNLVEHVRRTGARIVLLDLTLPGTDPLRAAAEVARDMPDCRVLFYSARNGAETMRSAFEAGAWGFVDKFEPVGVILDAMRRIDRGETAFPANFCP